MAVGTTETALGNVAPVAPLEGGEAVGLLLAHPRADCFYFRPITHAEPLSRYTLRIPVMADRHSI